MDERVIRALNRKTDREWDYKPTSQQYSDYLDLVKDWAYELETSEDVIERRLFQLGESNGRRGNSKALAAVLRVGQVGRSGTG